MRLLPAAAALLLAAPSFAAGDAWVDADSLRGLVPVRAPAALPAGYDAARAAALARAADAGKLGAFKGRCYESVAGAMARAGFLDRADWGRLGIGVPHAYMFAQWADADPERLRGSLGLERVPTPSAAADFPVGSIVVYERGLCGFSAASGHIEIVTRPGWACSDGCEVLWPECFGSEAARRRIHVYVPVAGPAAR